MTPVVRNLLLILAVVLVGSISYYFAIALPAHNRGMQEFEREKYQGELAAKGAARVALDACSAAAEKDYWDYIKGNSKPAVNKPGYVTAPTRIVESAQKIKGDALAECHRKYGARQ